MLLHFLRAVAPQSSTQEITLNSIGLLEDSIFDNQIYVNSGESVIEQISPISPVPVNLLAVGIQPDTVLMHSNSRVAPTTGLIKQR